MKRAVSIIVPAYNEAGNIVAAVEGVIQAAESAALDAFEIIVVDDGSTDGTTLMMSRWLALHYVGYYGAAQVHLRVHPENRGLRSAYETGLRVAQHPYVTWVPGDGEMATDSIANILRAIGSADLVIPFHGTPERRPWFRRVLTWVSTNEMNWLLGHRLHYWQGPVVYPTALARALPRTIPGFFCMAEMLAAAMQSHPTYVQIPLTHQERAYGISKAVSYRAIWNAQMAVLGFFWRFRLSGSPVPTPSLEVHHG